MTGDRIWLRSLSGLGLCLAAILLLEVFDVTTDEALSTPVPMASITKSAPPAHMEASVGDLASRLEERPLFIPGRRPLGQSQLVAQQPVVPLPRLTSILIVGEQRIAIFRGESQSLIVKIGDRIGTYTIQRIEPGRVTLAGAYGSHTLGTRSVSAAVAQ